MSDDEQLIRDLIETWVEAVHAGDEAGAVADRTDDIVMFDVPGPAAAARGIGGVSTDLARVPGLPTPDAVFVLVSLEVTAGADVAFAHALLRCGPATAPMTRSGDCASPWACARRAAGGSSPTSTTRSPT